MERKTGTTARGIRLPIISPGEDLANIVIDSVLSASESAGFEIKNRDVIGITEAIVAKSQKNFANVDDIAADVKAKFPGGVVGLTFPIASRNRFFNILKGISKGVDKLYVLLSYPSDEVGNPIVDAEMVYEHEAKAKDTLLSEKEFVELFGSYVHPFTDTNYIDLYKSAGDNIEIYFSRRPTDILKLTSHVLEGSIHTRELNKKRLLKEGAETVYTLCDILSAPINGSGYNENYGLLGSNLSTENSLKLFPRNPQELLKKVQEGIKAKTGADIEVMVYGDGAFKDPVCGIWELADPVVSPGYTAGLEGTPNEIKLKYIADSSFGDLTGDAKRDAVTKMIKEKGAQAEHSEGTTPRRYFDLLGSLCDLTSGSGDKGTPVVHIQGYFDDYSME